MIDTFETPHWFIHFRWRGLSWVGGKIGELRAFPQPVGTLDPRTRQPLGQDWITAFNVEQAREGGSVLLITLMQSLTRPDKATGGRMPMTSLDRFRCVIAALEAAAALGFTEVHYEDWHPDGTVRPRRLRTRRRRTHDFRDTTASLAQGASGHAHPESTY